MTADKDSKAPDKPGLDDWDCCRNYDTCTNACAPLVAILRTRLQAIDAAAHELPEATRYIDRGDRRRIEESKSGNLVHYCDYDALRARCVAAEARAHEGDLNLRAAYKDLTRVEGQRDLAESSLKALTEALRDVDLSQQGMAGQLVSDLLREVEEK